MEAMKEGTKVKELEREKERLIHRYLGLQDQADELNEQIYRVCCDVEILNRRIELAREEERKKAAKPAPQAAPNGNGHR